MEYIALTRSTPRKHADYQETRRKLHDCAASRDVGTLRAVQALFTGFSHFPERARLTPRCALPVAPGH